VFDITADDDEFAEAMTRAVRKVSRDVQVPGFRKGKAPRSLVERLYGREVFLREAADDVMERLYRDALKQEDITPVGEPSVEIVDLEPVNFVVTIPVYPAIELGDYTSVRVDPVDAAVTESDVEEVIQRLQKAQSPWVEVAEARPPVEGDQVTIDYEVMDGDQPFQDPVSDAVFILGETNLLASLRDRLEEMTVGETQTFELAFAEDDETADPTIRGKTLSYTVTFKGHKERQTVELDDEFATKVAGAESMDALREQIRLDIHQGKTTNGRNEVVNQIIEQMLQTATVDPPQTMIDEEVEHQLQRFKENLERSETPYEGYLRLQGKTEDDLKQELRPEAERRLRSSLLLAEIGRAEAVEVGPDEIDAEIDRLTNLIGPQVALDSSTIQAETEAVAEDDDVLAVLPDTSLTETEANIAGAGSSDDASGSTTAPPTDVEVADADQIVAEMDAVSADLDRMDEIAAEIEAQEAASGDSLDELEALDTELDELPLPPDAARAQLDQMQQFYRSDYFRNMLRTELYERKLTDRLIELATEGKGAVLNGWAAPELEVDASDAPVQNDTPTAPGTADVAPDEASADAANDEAAEATSTTP
jgi:trigger factor